MPLRITALLFALHCLLPTSCVASCKHRNGALLVQVDAGVGVAVGVDKDNKVFARFEKWTQLPGKMKHVTIGPAGLWGVDVNDLPHKFVGGEWSWVPELSSDQIDAGGDKFVAGVTNGDAPYCLPMENTIGFTYRHISPLNWSNIPGLLKYYSCGPYSCWGVNSDDKVFVRNGVNSSNCEGDGSWQEVPGSMSMIEVGSDGSVYGVNSKGVVYRRAYTSACKPEGSGWIYIPHFNHHVKHVSYDTGLIWFVLKNGHVYTCIA